MLGYTAVEHSIVWAMVLHFINNGIFSLLLAWVPMLQNILLMVLFLAGVAVFVIHGNDVRRYHRSLYSMPPKPSAASGPPLAPSFCSWCAFCPP